MDDNVRSFLLCEDGIGDLTDLPFWWELFSDEPVVGLDDLPDHLQVHTMRDVLLLWYYLRAPYKTWAWDGMRRLLATLPYHEKPVPRLLKWWAFDAASGRAKRPTRVGRPDKDARDLRIRLVFGSLRTSDFTVEGAIREIADVEGLKLDFEGVRAALRKGPFRRC